MKNKIKLSIILTLLPALLFSGCSVSTEPPSVADTSQQTTDSESRVMCLEQTPDMGQEYIDSLIFFGESTTYHLKSRGVLRDGKDTKQVWGPLNGTVNLDTTITALKIVYPQTNEQITIEEAVKRSKPSAIVLTFGLNGAVTKIKHGEKYFTDCYKLLTDKIANASPNTVIILQSCFPIAASMDMSNYSVDASTLNSYITRINSWTQAFASKNSFGYLNTAEALCDNVGFLRPEFDSGDGHHLTTEAYQEILLYIRTHAIKENL